MIESLNPEDQSLWKMTKRVMRIPDPNLPLQVPGGLAYSDLEKAKALADNLESQFQPVPVPPMQMDNVEQVRGAMESFALAPSREPLLTNPMEISKAIAELKVGKALRNLSRKALIFLTKVFNAVLKLQHYPAVWKHSRVISLLKPGKDPKLSSSYRFISLLDTVGKLFEMILLSRIMAEINS
jgi:hypothetical protein